MPDGNDKNSNVFKITYRLERFTLKISKREKQKESPLKLYAKDGSIITKIDYLHEMECMLKYLKDD